MVGHPAAQPDAEGGDLVLAARPLVRRPVDPQADPPFARRGVYAQFAERHRDPGLQRADQQAHVLPPPVQVEHDVDDALARAVPGVATAAPDPNDRQVSGVAQFVRFGAGPGGQHRFVFEQPDRLARARRQDRLDAPLHVAQRRTVGARRGRGRPFRRGTVRRYRRIPFSGGTHLRPILSTPRLAPIWPPWPPRLPPI